MRIRCVFVKPSRADIIRSERRIIQSSRWKTEEPAREDPGRERSFARASSTSSQFVLLSPDKSYKIPLFVKVVLRLILPVSIVSHMYKHCAHVGSSTRFLAPSRHYIHSARAFVCCLGSLVCSDFSTHSKRWRSNGGIADHTSLTGKEPKALQVQGRSKIKFQSLHMIRWFLAGIPRTHHGKHSTEKLGGSCVTAI